MSERISWKEYFMQITELVATRSTCDRAWVGCLLVNDDIEPSPTYRSEGFFFYKEVCYYFST